MTLPRRDEPFEVPVERLADGRRDGRRAAIAAIAIVAVVGGAVGLARWSADGTAATSRASGPPAPPGSAVAAASPSGGSGPPRRSIEPRVERLLDLPDRALAGAPTLVLIAQDDRDIRLLAWTSGSGLTERRRIPDALPTAAEPVVPILGPAGDRLVLLEVGEPSDPSTGTGRIVDAAGRERWSADHIAIQSGAVWSRDGRLVALAGTGRQWHLVRIDAAGRARDAVVDLPGEVFLPTPIPIGSMSVSGPIARTVPLGFSADGRWVYGGVVSPQLGILVGKFRVAADGRRVEPVQDFGVGRPDGLRPEPGTLGGRLVDPATGRVANWRVNADTSGGPPMLEVRQPDAAFAFTVDVAAPLGSGWADDGTLVVLSADSILYAGRAGLARLDRDGVLGPPIVATGPITTAFLLGVRDGYAAMGLTVTKPATATQVVLVDLDEPARIAGLTLPEEIPRWIIGAALEP